MLPCWAHLIVCLPAQSKYKSCCMQVARGAPMTVPTAHPCAQQAAASRAPVTWAPGTPSMAIVDFSSSRLAPTEPWTCLSRQACGPWGPIQIARYRQPSGCVSRYFCLVYSKQSAMWSMKKERGGLLSWPQKQVIRGTCHGLSFGVVLCVKSTVFPGETLLTGEQVMMCIMKKKRNDLDLASNDIDLDTSHSS